MKSPQVLIVGAGPAGLVAALSLLKNGVPVRIIEKDPQHHRGFRGSGIQPRTEEIEYFLGVLEDVKKYSFESPTRYEYNPLDPYEIIRTMKMAQEVDPTPAFPITAPFAIAQYQHQAVLRDHVERLGANVELGTSATAINEGESGVTVNIIKTSGGVEVKEQSKFAYVIGTDGGHSTIRKCLGLKFIGETREAEKRYIADVRVKGFTERGIHSWGGPSGGIDAVLRYAGEVGRYQIMLLASSTNFELLSMNKDLQTVQGEFNRLTKRDDIELLEVIAQGEWRPNIRMTERFRVGRVFIAGDAAHAHSPAGGQGLNSSIADTFNLGWKLALVLKGQAPPSLLDSYELERIPIISEMLQTSTSLHNKISQQAAGKTQRTKREEDAFYRGWRLFQLDLNYRHSPFVLDDRYFHTANEKVDAYGAMGHDIRAGDRAPDAPGLLSLSGTEKGKTTRLFELFSPISHTVLVFMSSPDENAIQATMEPILNSLKQLTPGLARTALIVHDSAVCSATDAYVSHPQVEFVLKDNEGHAFKNYGLGHNKPAIVVVRPDAYIGAFLPSLGGIEKYLSLLFGITSS